MKVIVVADILWDERFCSEVNALFKDFKKSRGNWRGRLKGKVVLGKIFEIDCGRERQALF